MMNGWTVEEDNTSRLVLTKGDYKIIRTYIEPSYRAWGGLIVVDLYKGNEFLTSHNTINQALSSIGEN